MKINQDAGSNFHLADGQEINSAEEVAATQSRWLDYQFEDDWNEQADFTGKKRNQRALLEDQRSLQGQQAQHGLRVAVGTSVQPSWFQDLKELRVASKHVWDALAELSAQSGQDGPELAERENAKRWAAEAVQHYQESV